MTTRTLSCVLISTCIWGCSDEATDSASTDAGDAAATSDHEPTADNATPTGMLGDAATDSDPLFGGDTEVEVEVPPMAEAGPAALPGLLLCPPHGGVDAPKLIDDLEDGDQRLPTQDGQWFEVKDASPGTFTLGVEEIEGGRGTSLSAIHAKGSANTEWGASFGVAWDGCIFDGSIYRGVRFWARGNGGPVRYLSSNPGVVSTSEGGSCDVETLCWDSHTAHLVFDSDWHEYFVPFDSLEQTGWGLKAGEYDPKLIYTVQFQTDQNEDFDYWIDDLSFYTDEDRALAEADTGAGDGSVGTPGDAGLTAPDAGAADASLPDASAPEPDASVGVDASVPELDASTPFDAGSVAQGAGDASPDASDGSP